MAPRQPKKKTPSPESNSVTRVLAHLDKRVTILELGMTGIGVTVKRLDDEVSLLRSVVKGIDERTIRGEKLMMSMQGEQREMMKLLGSIADSLRRHEHEAKPTPPVPMPQEPGSNG
jgi:hypothetical protein